MLDEFLDEVNRKGYKMSVRYDHDKKFRLCVSIKASETACVADFISDDCLHDEELFVSELKRLVGRLEGTDDGRS